MDAAGINAKIYKGRGLAAKRIGFPCEVFRPAAINNPLTQRITAIKCAFNAADSVYGKPNLYGKPVWFGDFDGRVTQAGDYLVRQTDGNTWFIAAQQSLLPIVCIECPRKLRVSRAAETTSEGVTSYSGLSSPVDLPDVLGTPDFLWPASILIGGRVNASTGLPAGVREAAWSVLLPPSVPITLQSSDIITDDLGRRFTIESAERSDLGYRMLCTEVHT